MKLKDYRNRIEKVMVINVPRKIKSKKTNENGESVMVDTPWKYIDSRQEKGVSELVYQVPIGYSYLDLQKQIDALYATCGAPVELKDYAGAVVIQIIPDDFPDSIPYDKKYLEDIKGKKEILIGLDRLGEPLIHSLRVPHMMIAGKSGYGKTDLIRWILFQLIHKNSPEEIEIWVIDMKGFSFLPFRNIPHIKKIVRDLAGAQHVLSDAVKIMESRAKDVWESGDRNKAASYKTIFVLIDEAYTISPWVLTNKESKKLASICDEMAAKISGTGREAGVGLLYCTQRPDADVINPLVKANMDCKIAFKTETASNSEIILDRPGAEKLPHGKPGRVLYSRDGLIEAQVPYLTFEIDGKTVEGDDAWEIVLQPYKEEKENDEGKAGLDSDDAPGHPDHLDGPGSEILLEQWQPIQTGKRSADPSREGEMDRGKAEGNREGKNLATVLDWSEAFRDRQTSSRHE